MPVVAAYFSTIFPEYRKEFFQRFFSKNNDFDIQTLQSNVIIKAVKLVKF